MKVNKMPELSQMLKKYKNSSIALFGLSIETEKVLSELNGEYKIFGLLDSYKEDGFLYGKRIVSLAEVVNGNVKLVLVIARPGSCKAIAKRIRKTCEENCIDLMDIRGNNLSDLKKATYDFRGFDGVTKKQMMQVIDENDVLSIDLFDTLVMRQTLFPIDIFDMVDNLLRSRGVFIENFCQKRLESEKNLVRSNAPTLTEIYDYIVETYSVSDITSAELADLEWTIDYGLIVPRQEICELIKEVYESGKEVYVVSDTYYTKQQLVIILEKCKFSSYTDIIASCNYKTSKTQHLFEKLQQKISGKACVHIGDDIVADVESAEKKGIISCRIYSGIELFEMVGYLGLWNEIEGVADRIKAGMFVSRLFNSPFQFETEERKITIRTARDVGYLFFAPVISDFLMWFNKQLEYFNLQNIWFSARDGYLIKRLYDELKKDVSSVYFLTSRMAAISAGMENEEDINYIGEMNFSGSLKEQLRERFDLTVDSIETKETLLDYSQRIFLQASVNKTNYKRYIKNLDVNGNDIAFFDFVAKGTSQMFIGRLVQNHIKGLYFLQLEQDNMKEKRLDILSFYKTEEIESSAIFDNYYILEVILTSPMPSVKGFSENGAVFYALETRTEEDILCIQAVQDGIFEYFKTYLSLCPYNTRDWNKSLDELFLTLIHSVSISETEFMNLKVEDPFFNRKTNLADLI